MKRLLLVCLVALVLSGCGLAMNAEYAERLDNAVLVVSEQARMAEEGKLSDAEMVQAIQDNVPRLQAFKDARGPWLGVSKVWMNTEQSLLLDKTLAWTKDMARRATGGVLTSDEMKHILRIEDELWVLFRATLAGTVPEEN